MLSKHWPTPASVDLALRAYEAARLLSPLNHHILVGRVLLTISSFVRETVFDNHRALCCWVCGMRVSVT